MHSTKDTVDDYSLITFREKKIFCMYSNILPNLFKQNKCLPNLIFINNNKQKYTSFDTQAILKKKIDIK